MTKKQPMTPEMIKLWLNDVNTHLAKAERSYQEQLKKENFVQNEVYEKYKVYLKVSHLTSSSIDIRLRRLRMKKEILEKILGYD